MVVRRLVEWDVEMSCQSEVERGRLGTMSRRSCVGRDCLFGRRSDGDYRKGDAALGPEQFERCECGYESGEELAVLDKKCGRGRDVIPKDSDQSQAKYVLILRE